MFSPHVRSFLQLLVGTVVAQTTLAPQIFHSTNLQGTTVEFNKTASTSPGYLFIEPVNNNFSASGPTIISDEGELVWVLPHHAPGSNFNSQTVNGTDYLTYWDGNGTASYGVGYGAVIFLDQTYTQVYNVCVADLNIVYLEGSVNVTQPCLLDLHESRVTPRGTLLATVRNLTQADMSDVGGPTDGYVIDSIFVEIDIATQEVLLLWSAVDHLDQLNSFTISEFPVVNKTGRSPDSPWDFFHMNAVTPVESPQAGYVVSSRYLNSAIKLDTSGNVEWYLKGGGTGRGGNFTLPKNAGFTYQHDIVAYNATESGLVLTMFDNNNISRDNSTKPSSGLELRVNTVSMTAHVVRRLKPATLISSYATGSFQLLPDSHVLVDYGHPAELNEWDADGTLIYQALVASESDYRAYKYAWTGNPATDPDIFAQHNSTAKSNSSATTTDIWVSWNGATEVQSWAFSVGNTQKSLHQSGTTRPRTGFETHARVEGHPSYVQASALDAAGNVLGTSMVVAASSGP